MRTITVLSGGEAVELPVAAFPLASGGAACLQLTDVGPLRRGGTYLVEAEGAPGVAATHGERAEGDAPRKRPGRGELGPYSGGRGSDPRGAAYGRRRLSRARGRSRANQLAAARARETIALAAASA